MTATYPTDATGLTRKPDKGYNTGKNFDIVSYNSQSGYEKSRIRSRKGVRTWDLSYTNINGVGKTAIENFYNDRFGTHETFIFDLTHVNETGTAFVKFSSSFEVQEVLSASSNAYQNFYTVSIKLKETWP